MDQPPQDPSQPSQPSQPAQPPAPAWGQPTQPAPAPGPAWGQPAAPPPQQYAPPAAPTGWAQPAGNQWVQPSAARGPVTGLAKLAGLVVLVFGVLWTGLGALIVLGGAAAKVGGTSAGLPGLGNAVGDMLAGFGIVILVIAVIEILGGIGVLLSKEWGRIIAIAYSLIFGLGSIFILLGAANARNVGTDDSSGGGFVALIIGLVFFLGYAYSLIVLMARWRGRA